MEDRRTFVAMCIVSVLVTGAAVQAQDAYARDRGGDRDDRRHEGFYTSHYMPHDREMRTLPHGYMRLIMGGLEYYYWEGMFYRMRSDRYVVVSAPVGALVTEIPQGSQPVVIDGVPYYNINGVTYMYTSTGYQVVPQPKTVVVKQYLTPQETSGTSLPAAANAEEAFTVNVPNAHGGYTAVTLKRSGSGFTGPQGEYYTEFPRIEQLKAMYAK